MLAIIPARSGSKRLPGKNVKPLCGLPLWRWSLMAAQRIGFTPLVTTDICEIIEYCWDNDVSVVSRDEYLCGDAAKTEDVILNALDSADTPEDGWFTLLQPTSPIRNIGDIAAMTGVDARCVISTDESGRRNGSVFQARVDYFRAHGFGGPSVELYKMAGNANIDIDTQEDFDRAEAALMRRVYRG